MPHRPFGIGTFTLPERGTSFVGVEREGLVWDVAALVPGPDSAAPASALALFENWDQWDGLLAEAMIAPPADKAFELAALQVEAPLLPRQIFCTGANYRKHVMELAFKAANPATANLSAEDRAAYISNVMDERIANGTPYAFIKLPSSIVGPFGRIILPRLSSQVDWELELAVVIGRKTSNVSREQARSHIAGYVVANDITCRDLIFRDDLKGIGSDWLASKNAETFLPLGPWIVPARFVPDPQDLLITLKLNGDTMQNESTADMLFDIARQIEYISSLVTLMPGDIICTGSPAGNGAHYGRFLAAGDIVEGSITGLGTQRLVCVDQA